MKAVVLGMFAVVVATASRPALAGPYLEAVSSRTYNQEPKASNAISVQPLNLLAGEVMLGLERELGSHASLVASPLFKFPNHALGDYAGRDRLLAYGLGGQLSLRLWTGGRALSGFFLEPFGGFHYMFAGGAGQKNWEYTEGRVIQTGARAGYQWLIGNRAVVTLAAGGVYENSTVGGRHVGSEAYKTLSKHYVSPDLRFGAGFAF